MLGRFKLGIRLTLILPKARQDSYMFMRKKKSDWISKNTLYRKYFGLSRDFGKCCQKLEGNNLNFHQWLSTLLPNVKSQNPGPGILSTEWFLSRLFIFQCETENFKIKQMLTITFFDITQYQAFDFKTFWGFFFIYYAFKSNPISFGKSTMFFIIEGVGIFRAKQEAQ